MLRSSSLDNLNGVRHGFFTREGGISGGIYASLNCGAGSNDSSENVRENRRRAAAWLDLEGNTLTTLYQVHSAEVIQVKHPPSLSTNRPRADAMVTDRPGVMLGILTADCVPVLFADAENGVVGAAHAGWRGALAGVVANTVTAMEALGAHRKTITAAVGPCIAQDSYQVGGELRDRFIAASWANDTFFRPDREDGKYRFDLRGYVRDRTAAAGISRVDVLKHDTYADEARFFSYRRSCHRGEDDYGRGLSAVVLGG